MDGRHPKSADVQSHQDFTTEAEMTAESHAIRTAILDDEPLARERLRDMLSREPDFTVVGEYRNGNALLRDLPVARPDLILADIEMPALSGFDVIERIRRLTTIRPFVVFVTAFGSYAVEAFDAEATDYLLKPFDRERFSRTLTRVRLQMSKTAAPPERRAGERKDDRSLQRLAVKTRSGVEFIHVDDIDWIEACANYVRIHVGADAHLFRTSMAALEQRLDRSRFVRIHRSTFVSIDRIVGLLPSCGRDQIVVLRNGTKLRLTATYRAGLASFVDGL